MPSLAGGSKIVSINPYPYKCDYCGIEKCETNFWYTAELPLSGGIIIRTWEKTAGWLQGLLDAPTTKHICGQQCLHRALDEFTAGVMAARPISVAATALPAIDDTVAGLSAAVGALEAVLEPESDGLEG
jgi:hypothetical protein